MLPSILYLGANPLIRCPWTRLSDPLLSRISRRRNQGPRLTSRTWNASCKPERPERLILRFGWDSHWGTMAYYLNHPFISDAAASWLADRGVKLLGMDTPMPDNPLNGRGTPNDSPVHKILLGREVILVEYLCNLQALKKSDVHLIVLPLNILGMDGSPYAALSWRSNL